MSIEIHPTVVIGDRVELQSNVKIGPYTVIDDDVVIGSGTEIHPLCHVRSGVLIGEENQIHAGAVIGGEPQDEKFSGGKVKTVIGNRNRIREWVSISGSADGRATLMGDDNMLMANAHIAHDCQLGSAIVMANCVSLAGHVTIADHAFLSGGVVVHQFCRIGRHSLIGGNAKVTLDVPPFTIADGVPARVASINRVGLKRAGFKSGHLKNLKRIFDRVFRKGYDPLTVMEDDLPGLTGASRKLIDEFLECFRLTLRGVMPFRRIGRE